jgi:hypothetical protein
MESQNQIIETEVLQNNNYLMDDISLVNQNENLGGSEKGNSPPRTRKTPKKQPYYMSESDDVSISDLDLIANKKKVNKRSTEMSVNDIISKKDSTKSKSKSKKKSSDVIDLKQQQFSENNNQVYQDNNYTKKSRVEDQNNNNYQNNYQKTNNHSDNQSYKYENDNEEIRRQKSELLYKFDKLNVNKKFSSLSFNMNSRLRDIQGEYERIKNQVQTERSVKFFQRMLLLGVQGVELLNTKFDPLGVDLDGWGESMAYSLENQEYDEVMQELYEKYKGSGQMAPETKLIFMIISSASMFAITKKLTKSDMGLGAIFGSLGKSAPGPASPPPAATATATATQIPFANMLNGNGSRSNQFNLGRNESRVQQDNLSDTTTDEEPSKLKGPDDNASIQEILQKMEEKRKAQQLLQEQQQNREKEELLSNDSTDILKNIPINKKRGRPAKRGIGMNR